MQPDKLLAIVTLSLLAITAKADTQESDFWFHDEGQTIFINGPKGAPLHIDYIGPSLTKPLKVRITPTNPALKVTPPVCTFTKKDDDCRLTVHWTNAKKKVYGINQFDVTEVGSPIDPLNAQTSETDSPSIGFGVGVQGKDMPKPVFAYWTASFNRGGLTKKVIITNATKYARDYSATVGVFFSFPACGSSGRDYGPEVWYKYKGEGTANILCYASISSDVVETKGTSREYNLTSDVFTLQGNASCYLDRDVISSLTTEVTSSNNYNGIWYTAESNLVSDVTEPNNPIYNGLGITGNNISNCSATGNRSCASHQWGSWRVGLANLGANDMDGGVKAGQVEVLQDYSWDSGGYIYWKEKWHSENLALVHMQGSTDGSEAWSASGAAPSVLEIQSAPPCSNYLKGDPSVTYKVIADVYGPGSVTMSGGKQCVIVKVPRSEFTRCTGSGIKDKIYEITAVPEVGKTFKGWNSKGLCDDVKPTCRIPLSSDVTIQPYFW